MHHALTVLNRASLRRRFDAYADVPWDEPDMTFDLDDPRLELPVSDPLGATDWYRSQPAETRRRLGLHFVCAQLRVGMDFEAVLSEGLLELGRTLELEDPARRYVLHEVIEEAQHTLMFRELILRSGLPTQGLTGLDRLHSYTVPKLARSFPEYFFFFVLGGEAPIDHAQREALRRRGEVHPLIERVMRIHVTEEARHLSFAEGFLRERVPRLGRARRAFLAFRVPIILGEMSKRMLEVPGWLAREYRIPSAVRREAYRQGPLHDARLAAGARSVRRLVEDIGLTGPVTDRLWRHWRITAPDAHARALA
ncbi:MAG: diiron oxygenase [Sandaracinaceae bacterium]|nr:diiron oxygenase [Sandaracinaceae bacterium]